jgi:hypothetical protein
MACLNAGRRRYGGAGALFFPGWSGGFRRMSDRNRPIGRCCYGLSHPRRHATTGECWNPWYFPELPAIAGLIAGRTAVGAAPA